jgi:hypothetical protein
MTRGEAEDRAGGLNREHPDRARYRWMAREAASGWEVVRVSIPGGVRLDPLNAVIDARPRPSPADDPRTSYDRNVGGPWVGGV